MLLPSFLKPFQEQAQEGQEKGLAAEVVFSRGTYQVQVSDPETQNPEWVFIQFDRQNRLKDCFCSCKKNEETGACLHQAIALLSLYGQSQTPLHCRFAASLWNCICSQLALRLGLSPKLFLGGEQTGRSKGEYVCTDGDGQLVLKLKGLTQAGRDKLHKILCQREKETEETSIKFSNLSEEELALWRQGHPAQKLSYELSHWSDLAKWWMMLQEKGIPYTISFQESKRHLPNCILITFPDLSIEYHFSEELLLELIPTLSTVHSPLKIQEFTKWSKGMITYDKMHHSFRLAAASPRESVTDTDADRNRIDLGEWSYVRGDGFYSNSQVPVLPEQLTDAEKALNAYLPLLKELLVEESICEIPTPLAYQLFFDERWTLHLRTYLFDPGDLSRPGSYLFNNWAYIDGKGFYRLEKRYFNQVDLKVPANALVDFISQHRVWLNAQEGFKTHISSMKSNLSYVVTASHALYFFRTTPAQAIRSHEFGPWLYVEGNGFFSKQELHTQIPVGATIPSERVVTFIKQNQEELQFVPHFFSQRAPVSRAGLAIRLARNRSIEITPDYDILPEYSSKQLISYGDYVYVKGEGFYELPPQLRLPEKYANPVSIKGDAAVAAFLDLELPTLHPLIRQLDKRIVKPHFHTLVATEFKKSRSGYLLRLNYETDLGSIPFTALTNTLKNKKRLLFSEAGWIDLRAEALQWVEDFKKSKVEEQALSLSSLDLFRLNAYAPLQLATSADDQQKALFREMTALQMPEMPDITGLKSKLRSYQELGVRWLWFLYHYGLSGLLCDDMGLGKTHQAMALLAAIANSHAKQGNGKKAHFLIVCPTSVIFHWQEKLEAYLPGLKVWTFHGIGRSLDDFAEDSDILLTSYGIWRNESERLCALSFEVAIFDELQIAKNRSSKLHHSLLSVDAKMKLGLTGTPIENKLLELKALFDIILPAYMPEEHRFYQQFIRPIEKQGDKMRQELLSRLVKPFILRRKKEDVLTDLPEKIEEVAHCELLADQKKLYQKVLMQSRERILDELQDPEAPIPYLHIFALFSHLKQICNHPSAFLKKPEEYIHHHSGKWELFKELLDEAHASGQKVVVFSQYLAMLDIIRLYLQKHKIYFAEIRGSTQNRGEQLQRFNNDPECEVFVASLQAAGLGIDLTAGSVVIHYDRWWNAARENQATDRVHRIGQTRGVQVFKLMTKETIEEHIHQMIDRKGKLMEELIGVDDHQLIKTFNRDELVQLFRTLSL